jgi:hypothetical protein
VPIDTTAKKTLLLGIEFNPTMTDVTMMIRFGVFSAMFLITLLSSTSFAVQSGSRNLAPSGNANPQSFAVPSQSFSTAQFNSPNASFNQQPTIVPNDFDQGLQLQSLPLQNSGQFQNRNSLGGNFQPTTLQPASSESSSPGIPPASIVDPIFQVNDPNSPYFVDHSAWNQFLSRYVAVNQVGINRVHYGRVSLCDRQLLQCYLQRLQATDVRTLNRNEQLAFWFNLYNARTVSIVLENYPIRSIRQIKQKLTDFVGPFDDAGAVQVLGRSLSLNDIESGIVRPIWNDPRIHYALNCASYGCPNLSPTAWTAFNIDGQLNAAAYNFINSGRAVESTLFGLRASKIYKWYEADFGGSDQAVLAHLLQYANAQTASMIRGRSSISGHFYDWSLNDGRIQRQRFAESLRR